MEFCDWAVWTTELAWTCHDYAECLLESFGPGDAGRAYSLLNESLAILTELRIVERISPEEATGYQPIRALARLLGLTRRAEEVLRLIAGGKTDREIASGPRLLRGQHTANTGCANRGETATNAIRRDCASRSG